MDANTLMKIGTELKEQGVAMPWTALILSKVKTKKQAQSLMAYLKIARNTTISGGKAIEVIMRILDTH